ncbi:MAG TPA: RDD family protein [Candidatus Nanoarchaeia archaeon]|nr:RDD family protein [Candidatus Nanoarchaeia archaeon]
MARKKGLNLPKERTFSGPASLWKRIAAFMTDLLIIDIVILFPLNGVVSRLIPKFSSFSEAVEVFSSGSYNSGIIPLAFMMAILFFLYFTWMEYKIKQTPGKMLFRISIKSDLPDMKLWQAVTRNIFAVPIFPFFLLGIMDFVFLLFNKTGQRLSEILSKTRTVEEYPLDG